MAQVTYVPADPDTNEFGFHGAGGELLLVKHDAPLQTEDAGVIAYLDSVPFVKRAGGSKPKPDPSGGEEA